MALHCPDGAGRSECRGLVPPPRAGALPRVAMGTPGRAGAAGPAGSRNAPSPSPRSCLLLLRHSSLWRDRTPWPSLRSRPCLRHGRRAQRRSNPAEGTAKRRGATRSAAGASMASGVDRSEHGGMLTVWWVEGSLLKAHAPSAHSGGGATRRTFIVGLIHRVVCSSSSIFIFSSKIQARITAQNQSLTRPTMRDSGTPVRFSGR